MGKYSVVCETNAPNINIKSAFTMRFLRLFLQALGHPQYPEADY